MLIAYAAAPGRPAPDGAGRNSLFTQELASALASQAAEPISLVMEDVQARVRDKSGGAQEPSFTNRLGVSRWSFVTATPPSPAAPRIAPDAEAERLRRENAELQKRLADAQRQQPAPVAARPDAPASVPPPSQPPALPSLRDGQTFRDCADCPEMVVIPAGSFVMGSPSGEAGRQTNEGPQRTVSIARFAAGKFEVTFDEWAACVAGGGCRSNGNPGDRGWGRGRRPVINVSWNDAQEYVQWLSQKTGRRYSLLTEAQWEYAARAGTSGRLSNNGAEQQLCQIANHADQSTSYPWKNSACSDGVGEQTTPVGRYAANGFSLYDVHGNVWEWVQDCFVSSYSGAPTDGSVVTAGDCSLRVLRGGSWSGYPQGLRSAYRLRYSPTVRGAGIGFRLARTLVL